MANKSWKPKCWEERLSIELKKLTECKKTATTAASKSIEVFNTKIFAIEEKLRKFCRMDFVWGQTKTAIT